MNWPNYPRTLSNDEVEQEATRRKRRIRFWRNMGVLAMLVYVAAPVMAFVSWGLVQAWNTYHWLPFAILGGVLWLVFFIWLIIIGSNSDT
jgi:uncharacterized membrane protein YcjF (UPF0283 family)